MFKKLMAELGGLSWTLAGTALVLITLSGQTKKYGLIISAVALGINLLVIAFKSDD